MAFMIGTVKCQCANVMGMPTDSGECTVEGCREKKSFWGEKTLSRLRAWAEEHTLTHPISGVIASPMGSEFLRPGEKID